MSRKEEMIDRHCRKYRCKAFIPGEPEEFRVKGVPVLVRLGPCPDCGGWNVLERGETKTTSVREEYFEARYIGLMKHMELSRIAEGIPGTRDVRRQFILDQISIAVRAFHVAGRALIVEKESCEHGEFLAWLDEIGLPHRTAERWMLFGRTTLKAPSLQSFGPKKVELLVSRGLDAEEAEKTGCIDILDMPMDAARLLSYKEMKEKLEAHARQIELGKKQLEARDKQLELKDKKIRELEGKAELYDSVEEEWAARFAEWRLRFDDLFKNNFEAAFPPDNPTITYDFLSLLEYCWRRAKVVWLLKTAELDKFRTEEVYDAEIAEDIKTLVDKALIDPELDPIDTRPILGGE